MADTTETMQDQTIGTEASLVYDVFLSYVDDDRPVAVGIQRSLHQIGRRVGQLRSLRVFRDPADLTASPDLWGKVTEAMDRSRYMIALLSPRAAASAWANKEVEYWLAHRGPDQVMLVVADGQLTWDEDGARFDPDCSNAALPVLTQPGVWEAQPFYVDVSDDAPWDPAAPMFREKVTNLAAPIHGKTKDHLASEDLREQRRYRRLRSAAVAGLVVLTVFSIVSAMIAIDQRQELLRLSQQPSGQAQPSAGPQPFFVFGSAIFGAFVGAALLAFAAYINRVARRGRHGLLAIAEAIDALSHCDPKKFNSSELHNRRKVNHEIERIAGTIEGIPAALKIRDPAVIRAATERGAGIRALKVRIASLTQDGREAILAELVDIKRAYDSGRWLDIPAVEVQVGSRPTLASRILWIAATAITFIGIVAMVVLSAMGRIPQSIGAPVTFVLGLILYAGLARLGISAEAMKSGVEVTTKATGGLGKPGRDA
jgi:hypothetical protein